MAYFIPFTVSGELELLYMLGFKAPKVKMSPFILGFGTVEHRA